MEFGLAVDPKGQHLGRDVVEHSMDRPANSPQCIQQYLGAVHETDLPNGDAHTA
jgi:hypothetical protein